MSKEPYNWWTDPKNKEEVERLSWWARPENQGTVELPVAITQSDNYWIIATNEKTEAVIGDKLSAVSQGKTKEEAIKKFFTILRIQHDYSEECRMNYQRFVPFRKGDWKHTGGKWFVVFGYHFYFRTGNGMKGGWYVPFTKLNISIHSEWKAFRRWKQERKNKKHGK